MALFVFTGGLTSSHVWKHFKKFEFEKFSELDHPYVDGLFLAGVLNVRLCVVYVSVGVILILFVISFRRSKQTLVCDQCLNRYQLLWSISTSVLVQDSCRGDSEAQLSLAYFLQYLTEVAIYILTSNQIWWPSTSK